nr:hypothetical protein Iba_chr07dCG3990 [Ipomoea batatas]
MGHATRIYTYCITKKAAAHGAVASHHQYSFS